MRSHQEDFGISFDEALRVGEPVLLSYAVNTSPEIDKERVGFAEEETLAGTVRLLERWFH